jgi:hypothetical protein
MEVFHGEPLRDAGPAGERPSSLSDGPTCAGGIGCPAVGRSSRRVLDRPVRGHHHAVLCGSRRRDRRLGSEEAGVHVDSGQIAASTVAAATAAFTAGFEFMNGWQKHEENVADGKSSAMRQAPPQKHREPEVTVGRVRTGADSVRHRRRFWKTHWLASLIAMALMGIAVNFCASAVASVRGCFNGRIAFDSVRKDNLGISKRDIYVIGSPSSYS